MIEPEYIDIHSHISFPHYDKDREAVIERMKEKNIWAIDVGTDFENSKRASGNAAANHGIFASAGLHPADDENEDFDTAAYKNYSKILKSWRLENAGWIIFASLNLKSHRARHRLWLSQRRAGI